MKICYNVFLEFEHFAFDLSTAVRDNKLSYEERFEVSIGVARLVADLAPSGVDHRDIKAGNILIKKKNNQIQWTLTDWGIGYTDNVAATIVGTPGFSSDVIDYALDCDYYSTAMFLSFVLMEEDCFWSSMFKPQKTDQFRKDLENHQNKWFSGFYKIINQMLKAKHPFDLGSPFKITFSQRTFI